MCSGAYLRYLETSTLASPGVEKMRLDVVLFQNDFLLPPYVGPSTRWVLVDNRSQHATPSAERPETQTCHVRPRAACLCKLLTPS